MSLPSVSLSDSAFLATVDGRDRNFWRFLATLVLGIVVGFLVALLVGSITLVAFVLLTQKSGFTILQIMLNAGHVLQANGSGLRSSMLLMVLAVTTNGSWAVVFLAIAAAIGHRQILEYLTAARRFRWRQLLVGLGLSGAKRLSNEFDIQSTPGKGTRVMLGRWR